MNDLGNSWLRETNLSARSSSQSSDDSSCVDPSSRANQLGFTLARTMRRLWQAGDRLRTEHFLDKYPQLRDEPEQAIELIYEEYCLRQASHETDATRDIVQRFPQWAGPLRVLIDCHRALECDGCQPKLPAVGDMVSGFKLLAELGRGSHGRVFLSAQAALADRPVVLKITPLDSGEHLSLARMQHTNIVPLHSVIDDSARAIRILCMPYFGRATLSAVLHPTAHQVIQANPGRSGTGDDAEQSNRALPLRATTPLESRTGQTIADAIDRLQDGTLATVTTAGTVRQMFAHVSYAQAISWIVACLADALDFAHVRGLVHLDVKPSNVLLAPDGQPMLLDFHLARAPIESSTSPPERFGGTPSYMSPEQRAALQILQSGGAIEVAVDGRSDVFALGAILYESLGGQLPVDAKSPPLFQVNPQVSIGLSDIVAKCLAHVPENRYSRAAELADDLRRHLTDQPLTGVPNRSLAERWRKYRRRRSSTIKASGVFSAFGVTFAMIAMFVCVHWSDRRDQAVRALRQGETQLQSGHHAEAVQWFQRGLEALRHLPFQNKLALQLRDRLAFARRLHITREVHLLANEIRGLYGMESVSTSRLQSIDSQCQAVWSRRGSIVACLADKAFEPRSIAGDSVADLHDIAIFAADLRVRLSDGPHRIPSRQQAIRMLDEAAVTFGSSSALEYERRRLIGSTDGHEPAGATNGLVSAARSAREHYALGRALLAAGELASARRELTAALDVDPAGLWPNFYFGICAYRMSSYEDAIAAFSVCIGLAPNEATYFYNRALSARASGRTDLALADYGRALRIDPTHLASELNRAMLHCELGQFGEAAADLRSALEHGADPATVYRDLDMVHAAMNDRDDDRLD